MRRSLLFFVVASALFTSTLGALFTSATANSLGSTNVAASSSASFSGSVTLAGGLNTLYTFSLNVTNTGSSSGTVSLASLILLGVTLDTGLSTPTIATLTGNVGFQLNSTLTTGTYSVSLTLTPPALSLSAQTSLFYVFNATDGSNSASSSGSQDVNLYGAVPFTPVDKGFTFQLRPVQLSTYLLANLDFSASTVAFPVLFGAANTLVANVNTTLRYGQQFSVSVLSQANATATVVASKSANLAKNAAYKLSSDAQTAYSDAQAFFNITVSTAATTTYTLAFQLNSTVTQEQANLYVWAKVEVDGTLTLLQTASNTGKKIVASATSAGQYALFRSVQVANGTYEALVRNLAGNTQTTSRVLLASFVATGQSTTTVSSSAYVFPAASNNLIQSAYSLAISASNSGSSGRINVYAVVLTSVAYQTGVQAGPSYTNTSTNAQLYYGIQVTSELAPGTFSVNLTFTASANLQSQLQLFYLFNASDAASASGNAQANAYAATVFTTTYGKTFTLPSAADSTYLMGSFNTSLGFPLVATVYGLPSTVAAGVQTLLTYGNAFLLQISSAAETSVTVVFSTSSSVAVNFGASAATYTSLNAFFDVSVSDQSSLTANLYYPINQTALAARGLAANTLTFVYVAADGTAQVLPTTQTTVNGQAVITASTNHFSTYAVYSGSQTNNNATPTNSTKASGASQVVAAVALVFAAFFAFAL